MAEPRTDITESISHTKNTYKSEYPKTEKRCSVGNLPEDLHDQFCAFCESHVIGHAEGLAALLDFVSQHEAHYEKELKESRSKKRR